MSLMGLKFGEGRKSPPEVSGGCASLQNGMCLRPFWEMYHDHLGWGPRQRGALVTLATGGRRPQEQLFKTECTTTHACQLCWRRRTCVASRACARHWGQHTHLGCTANVGEPDTDALSKLRPQPWGGEISARSISVPKSVVVERACLPSRLASESCAPTVNTRCHRIDAF